jgi:hypothetical protein
MSEDGMSMRMVPRIAHEQRKTLETIIIEFMRKPFGGAWLGEAGWFSAVQVSVYAREDGAEIRIRRVRETLLRMMREGKTERALLGTTYVYRLKA